MFAVLSGGDYICILFILLSVAAVYDFTTEKIPNELILIGIISGFVYRIPVCGEYSVAVLLRDLFLPLLIFFIFFILKVFGAGDIKLLMVCGLFLGTDVNLCCICLALAVAAMSGLIRLLIHGILLSRFESLLRHIQTSVQMVKRGGGEIGSYLEKSEKEKVSKVHFSFPILLGALGAVLITPGAAVRF